MAKIKAGILSKVSGKVAGVVGSTWKGQNYLRELVKPSNPNTPLQQAQRSQMRAVVACARLFTGDVFKPYLDKFLKNMSGYNWFVKNNIKKFSGTDNALASALAFSSGNLASGNISFGSIGGGLEVTAGDDIPAVAEGHTCVLVGIFYDDTKKTGLAKSATVTAEGDAAIAVSDLEDLYGSSDHICMAGFYVDVDANGVVQAISTSKAQTFNIA